MQFESDPAEVDDFVMQCLDQTEELLRHAYHATPVPSAVNRLAHVWANICAVFPGFRRFKFDWQLLCSGRGEITKRERESLDKTCERLRRMLLCVVYSTATFGVQSDEANKHLTASLLNFQGKWCEQMHTGINLPRWELAHIEDIANDFVVDCELSESAMAEQVKSAIVNGIHSLDHQGDEGLCMFGKPLILAEGDSWGIDHT